MNTLINNYGAIEKLIYDEGLRIEAMDFHPDLVVMMVVIEKPYCIKRI